MVLVRGDTRTHKQKVRGTPKKSRQAAKPSPTSRERHLLDGVGKQDRTKPHGSTNQCRTKTHLNARTETTTYVSLSANGSDNPQRHGTAAVPFRSLRLGVMLSISRCFLPTTHGPSSFCASETGVARNRVRIGTVDRSRRLSQGRRLREQELL